MCMVPYEVNSPAVTLTKVLTKDAYGCNVAALQPKSSSHHALTSVLLFI